jgi:signal transduction histidine kinase
MASDKVNILIVDDKPDKLMALSAVLDPLGQNLVLAMSGEEGLKRLLEREFAVILLDVNMPGMDGFETAGMIRKHRRCTNTPIIFITAFAEEMFMTRGYALGAVDYIMSPVVPDILRTKVGVFVDLFRKTEQIKRLAEERVALAREQAARAAAEEANRRKDEFLAVLSHELRNPLAPIRNVVHILRMAKLPDPDLRKATDVLDRQVNQLARMVDDLLDIFRIIHGKIILRREATNLLELVRATAEDHRAPFERAQIGLEVEIPDQPVWVFADRVRLTQILNNLFHNAAKFTDPGGKVNVRIHSNGEAQSVHVSVRDTGIGITPDLMPHLFETFSQADHSIDRRRGGLGLGLALVKGLVELHGGTVKASSAGLGLGTEVDFSLPLSDKPTCEEPPKPAVVPSSRQLRILIVEDNVDSAKTLGTLLSRFGHEVNLAHNGTEGIAIAKDWLPEVVLCDIGLPGMDGFEVARALRRDKATAPVRLIALSGYGQDEDRQRSQAAGFDLHLTKPVDPEELQKLLAVIRV